MTTRYAYTTRTIPIDVFARSAISGAVTAIADETVFLDEAFESLRTVVFRIGRILYPEVKWIPVTISEPVTTSMYSDLLSDMSLLARLSHATVDTCFSRLQSLCDYVTDQGEKIAKTVAEIDRISRAMSAEILRQSDSASVKDESLVYDTISGGSSRMTGTLLYDTHGGCRVLPVKSSTVQPFTIDTVRFNRSKGSIGAASLGKSTDEIFGNGVYLTRVFGENPVFEIDDDADLSAMSDGDMKTAYHAEFNTRETASALRMDITIIPAGKIVTSVSITADPGGTGSAVSKGSSVPSVAGIRLSENGGTAVDRTETLVGDAFSIKETTIGASSLEFSRGAAGAYPEAHIYLQSTAATELILSIESGAPTTVEYPELVFVSDTGSVIRRLSYPETLIADNYVPAEGRPGPMDWYPDEDISTIRELTESDARSQKDMIQVMRHEISLADITLYSHTFETSGYLETENIFSAANRSLVAIEVFSSEVKPDGTAIRYLFTCDDVNWHEIAPSNHSGVSGAKRIVCAPLEAIDSDVVLSGLFSEQVKNVRMKIIMTGNGRATPMVKSYAVRMKTEVDE